MGEILIPGILIAGAGVIVGALASGFVSARTAAAFGRGAALGVVTTATLAVLVAISLPRQSVNGPIGATCPDLDSTLGHALGALAILSLAAGAAAVAAATVEGARRAGTGGTFGRIVVAVVVPYVAVAAWIVPALCDYT